MCLNITNPPQILAKSQKICPVHQSLPFFLMHPLHSFLIVTNQSARDKKHKFLSGELHHQVEDKVAIVLDLVLKPCMESKCIHIKYGHEKYNNMQTLAH